MDDENGLVEHRFVRFFVKPSVAPTAEKILGLQEKELG
ncbi:hypothetical protein C943_01745 [Mariniradius saccharolyticus AK6]|uniref:Uncharacterized protein n=1 Tax=Mariniradius saccharolyticus AK6 TaxID=1239962 RepID=M7X3F3_9BACT|nr:hypothetical protein C943_01745 [Mariniradius saccharolyticus AK6]